MAEFDGGNKVEGVFGGINYGTDNNNANVQENAANFGAGVNNTMFEKVESKDLPTKPSIWSKIRSFLFQEVDLTAPVTVELTPYQQKVEDEINEFLHQEISFKGFFNLFKK